MSGNQQNYSVQVKEVVVGLSAVISYTLQAGQQALAFQSFAGGTCYFGGTSLAVGGSFGMLVPTTILQLTPYRGGINFAAVGATATIRVLSFFSAGL